MTDLSQFDINGPGNPKNTIFGLPFSEEEASLVIVPVPWEVTVSFGGGTSRAAEYIFTASMQVDVFDPETNEAWKQGIFMRHTDRKLLMKSDYLRKEAELYIDYTSKGENVEKNGFMCKSLKEINEGSVNLNKWVYEQTRDLLTKDKLVVLLGGDHSTPFGYYRALAEKHGEFGILQIDAHADLRKCYENFDYSHASIMYNALEEIPQITKLVQLGIRDYSQSEWEYINTHKERIHTFFDREIKERMYEGETWKRIVDEVINALPQKVFLSFDIDGLDPKLSRHTGTPVPGGFEVEQILYLMKKLVESGREFIGLDLVEVGIGETGWDANVAARILWKLCNLLLYAGNKKAARNQEACATTL